MSRSTVWIALRLWLATLVMTSAVAESADGWSLPADPAGREVPEPRRDLRLPLVKAAELVVCPQHPSDFVLVVSRDSDHTVWSLSEAKVAGRVNARFRMVRPEAFALNADGTLAASAVDYSDSGLDVWDTATGKLKDRLDPGASAGNLQFLEFAGTDRLVSYPGADGKNSIAVWNLSTGEPERTLLTPVDLERGAVATSAGGKYLAVAASNKNLLLLYDLTTGQLVQQVSYPKASGGFWDDCHGLAFSADGRELAGVFQGQPSQLRVWDLPTGELTIDASISADPHAVLHGKPSYRGHNLLWSPDANGWLCYGFYWVDRESLRVVREFEGPNAGIVTQIQPLASDLVLHCVRDGLAGTLRTQPLDPTPTVPTTGGPRPLLKPGDAVCVRVTTEGVRCVAPEDVERECRAALEARLQQLGLKSSDTAPLSLEYRHRESEGKLLPRPVPRVLGAPLIPPPLVTEPDQAVAREGTGFVVTAEGHVVTCAHVCGELKEVQLQIGDRRVPAKVLAVDEKTDLALLKYDGQEQPFLRLRDSEVFELGEDVRVVGFPLSDLLGDSIKVTKGSISGIVSREGQKLFMIDAVVNPGNSGGPLIDQHGRVLGINAKMLVGLEVDNVGISIPANRLQELCRQKQVTLPAAVEEEALTGGKLLERLSATVAIVRTGTPNGAQGSLGEARATNIDAAFTLRAEGREEPLWSLELKGQSHAIVVHGDWNDANLRKSEFQRALRQLQTITPPYFISADGSQRIPQLVRLNAAGAP
jgi:S1-C subfamily serine protease